MRIQIQNRLPDRIDLGRWDLVEYRHSVDYIGELCSLYTAWRILVSSTRVVDAGFCGIEVRRIGQVRRALGEVAGALQVSGNDPFNVDRVLLAYLFEIDKEEGLVLPDRAAQREAVLIAQVIRLGPVLK